MKDTLRLVAVLTVICLAAGTLLAWTNQVTRKPIEDARRREMTDALARVLPPCDNDLLADRRALERDGQTWTFFVARRGGAVTGIAFTAVSPRGYGGPIEILVGLTPEGAIRGLEVLRADNETPGLGAKIREQGFRAQFKGRSTADTAWCAVRKDQGDIEAITGATISSRAVAEAVKAGLETYREHAADLAGSGVGAP